MMDIHETFNMKRWKCENNHESTKNDVFVIILKDTEKMGEESWLSNLCWDLRVYMEDIEIVESIWRTFFVVWCICYL